MNVLPQPEDSYPNESNWDTMNNAVCKVVLTTWPINDAAAFVTSGQLEVR